MSVGLQKLPTTLLTFVALSTTAMTVLQGLSCAALRAFHSFILSPSPLRFQQRPRWTLTIQQWLQSKATPMPLD